MRNYAFLYGMLLSSFLLSFLSGIIAANVTNATLLAMGFARGTYITTMKNEPMMGNGDLLGRKILLEGELCLQRSF